MPMRLVRGSVTVLAVFVLFGVAARAVDVVEVDAKDLARRPDRYEGDVVVSVVPLPSSVKGMPGFVDDEFPPDEFIRFPVGPRFVVIVKGSAYKKNVPRAVPLMHLKVGGKILYLTNPDADGRKRDGMWNRLYYMACTAVEPAYDVEPAGTTDPEKLELVKYADESLADVRLHPDKYEGDRIHVEAPIVDIEDVSSLGRDLVAAVGLDADDWKLLVLADHRKDGPFLLMPTELEDDLATAERLARKKVCHVYGKVESFAWTNKKWYALMAVHRIMEEKYDPRAETATDATTKTDAPAPDGATATPTEKETKTTTGKRENSAADPAGEAEADNGAEGDPVTLSGRELQERFDRYDGVEVSFVHVFRGTVALPRKLTEAIPFLAGRPWMALRNRGTDMEGVFLVYDEARDDMGKQLANFAEGDSLVLTGEARLHERARRTIRVFILQRVSSVRGMTDK